MRRIAKAVGRGVACVALVVAAGCAPRAAAPRAVTVRWFAGRTAPAFDPDGPPDPLRRALEGALSYGLFARDSAGETRPLAADRAEWSDDGRTLTLRLRAGLRFTDGTPATSVDFRDALLAGLARSDHGTAAWLLQPLAGLERLRPGRPLPALGIETPDPGTLVLRLARQDSSLLERLACPGIGVPWKRRSGADWAGAVGLGPWRVLAEDAGKSLTLVRADTTGPRRSTADTLAVRFGIGAPRVRVALRRLATDFAWPLPPALLEQALPAGNHLEQRAAAPARRLLLVLRADVPPTTRMPARAALAHALNRSELLTALGQPQAASGRWLEGAGPFEFPRLDAGATREWLARGDLGASFHVVLAFDADGAGAEVARAMQGQWAALGLYAELQPLRGPAALAAPLAASAAQAQLVETQAPLPGAAAELATLVMPLRGPAPGSVRTGWRTREFDPWIVSPGAAAGGADRPALDPVAAQGRLADEGIALPLADLPWRWVVRDGGPIVPFDPTTGPVFTSAVPAVHQKVTSASGSR
jgi:ABC-type transport system substrate-binding protein